MQKIIRVEVQEYLISGRLAAQERSIKGRVKRKCKSEVDDGKSRRGRSGSRKHIYVSMGFGG